MEETVTRFVANLTTTPVKGTFLDLPSKLSLGENGVVENRRFYLADADRRLFNGKQHGPLVQIKADLDSRGKRLDLHFPDGQTVTGQTTELGDALRTDLYGRSADGHALEGPWSQALSTFVGQPVTLVAADRPGDAVDVHPVTLVSSASIEYLRTVTRGGKRLSHRRFRMLVELGSCGVHEEDPWVGRRLRVGQAVVAVVGPVPRCVVTTQNPDDGRTDFNTLKAIVRYRGELASDLTTPVEHLPDNGKVIFGMYAVVDKPGEVALGDPAELLDEALSTDDRGQGEDPRMMTSDGQS